MNLNYFRMFWEYKYKDVWEIMNSFRIFSELNTTERFLFVGGCFLIFFLIFYIFPFFIHFRDELVEKRKKKKKKQLLTQIMLQKEIEDEIEKEIEQGNKKL